MLRNYFLVSLRNLTRNKTVSLIHIAGFGLGIAAFLFAAQTVVFEYSFDNFHKNGDRIFEIAQSVTFPGGQFRSSRVDPAIAHRINGSIPEVQYVARYIPQTLEEAYGVFTYTDPQGKQKSFNEPGTKYADKDFLNIFQFPLIGGDAEKALADNSSLVMTRSCARKYFGNDDPIGKTLELTTGGTESYKTKYNYQVSAILEDLPDNSSLQFDILLPFSNFEVNYKQDVKNLFIWYGSFHNFILLRDVHVDLASIESRINSFFPDELRKQQAKEGVAGRYELQPLHKIHFDPYEYDSSEKWRLKSSSKTFVSIVGIIGLSILLIAGVNYINLTTAKALKRAREVGIRKVVGAGRFQLIQQFILDAVFVNLLGLLFALTLLQICKPFLASWMGLGVPEIVLWSYTSLILILILVACILISGIVPAMILTKTQPVTALKGKITQLTGGSIMRKSLVVVQFGISVALIIFTYAIIAQLGHMHSRDTGFDRDQRVVIHAQGTEDFDFIKFRSFKERILRDPKIMAATAGHDVPGSYMGEGPEFSDPDRPDEPLFFDHSSVDYDFAKTLNIAMLAGKEFTEGEMTQERVVMINETALKQIGLESPEDAIGKTLTFHFIASKINLKIIGVTEDCTMQSPGRPVRPLVYMFADTGHPFPKYSHYLVHIAPGQTAETVHVLEKEFHEVFTNAPFEYTFLDENFQSVFAREEKIQAVASMSSLLAIFIACMGLGGLVSYSVTQRTKEIGIRKTLGASVGRILFLLSNDFIKLVLISIFFALPAVWYAIQEFLNNYEYRIDLSVWIFVIPCLVLLVIAGITMAYQTVKAASANPVEALKYE